MPDRRPLGLTDKIRAGSSSLHDTAEANVILERKDSPFSNSCADVIYKLVISLANNLDINELYQNIVNSGCELASTSHGFIYVVNEAEEVLELKFGTGIYTYYKGVLRSKDDPSVSSVVWNTGRILAVGDISQWEGRAQDRPYGGEIVKSVLGIPLHSGDEVIAVIGIGFETVKLELTDEQVDLLSRFAAIAAIALNNARLYSALNTKLLAQIKINQTQQFIIEQINLYSQELILAQATVGSQTELSAENLADHYEFVRRLRRITQRSLAGVDLGISEIKPTCQKQKKSFEELLTIREKTVLGLIASGLSNQEIAAVMGVTINTVKTHANHIFGKLGVNRRSQALIKAREVGLL